jgi:hypothetical protein
MFFPEWLHQLAFPLAMYEGSFSPQPLQNALLVVFLMMGIQTAVKWNLSVVLICISFMARDGEHFFMCFLAF